MSVLRDIKYMQERLANSERRIPDLKQVVAEDCSHSSGEHTPTQVSVLLHFAVGPFTWLVGGCEVGGVG